MVYTLCVAGVREDIFYPTQKDIYQLVNEEDLGEVLNSFTFHINVMVQPLKSERCNNNNNMFFPLTLVPLTCFNAKGSAGPIGPRGDPGFEGSVVSYSEDLWVVPR